MSSRLIASLLLAVLASPADAAPLKVATEPPEVVLGRGLDRVTIHVEGLAGQGKVFSDANVGTVERLDPTDEGLRIRYRPPETSFPQTLCLLLWRDQGPVRAVRIPLLGRTRVPVKTRRDAVVRVHVGGGEFGPFATGVSGRVTVPVQVPPGVRTATVEVTDKAGMQSTRRVAISRPRHNQLALAMSPRTVSSTRRARFRITVAVAEPRQVQKEPVLVVQDHPLRLRPSGSGLWSAVWAPAQRPRGGISLRASIPGDPRSVREASVNISAGELRVHVQRVRSRPVTREASPLQGSVGLALGMTHSLGDMVAPRLGVELALEYPLLSGFAGLRLFSGYGRATQNVAAPAGLGAADSSVMMVPLGAGVSYRAPLPYVTPYVIWGCMAQIVRTSTSAAYLAPERSRTDLAFGVLGLAGVSRQLGPGRLFLQLGYQWSRVENEDVEVLAGGLVLEGGYRLEI